MEDHDALVERIRARAFEISQRESAGTSEDNWMLAEHEIRQQDAAKRAAVEAARAEGAAVLEVAHRTALTHP